MYSGGNGSSSSSKLIPHQQQQQQQQQNSPSLNEYQVSAAQPTAMNNPNIPISYIQSTQGMNMKMIQSLSHSSMMNAHPSTLSSSASLNQIATSGNPQMVAVSAPGYYINSQQKMYSSLNTSQFNPHQISHYSLLGPVPINDLLSHNKTNAYQNMPMQANTQTLPSLYTNSSFNYVPNQSSVQPTQSTQIPHQAQSSLITLTDSTNPSKRANETNSSVNTCKVNTNTYSNASSQPSKLPHAFSPHRSKMIINKSRYYLNNKIKQPQQTNETNSPTANIPNESQMNSTNNHKHQKPVDSASSDAYLSKLKNCIDANRRNINQRLYLNSNSTQNSSDMNFSIKTACYEYNDTKTNQKSSNQQYHYQSNKPLIVIKPAENFDEEILPKKLKRETTENLNSSDLKGEDLQVQKKICKPEQAPNHKTVTSANNNILENSGFVIELSGTLHETNTAEAHKHADLNNNLLFSLKVNMFYCKACCKLLNDKNCVKEHMSSIHNVK
jgi:hypothetical protein